MSAEKKNKLDKLFKSGLDVPDTHFEYNDQDWDDLENLMGGRKRPRIIAFWLPVLSGVAALLLLFWGWWFFKPAKLETQQVAVVKQQATKAPVNNSNSNTNTVNGANGNTAITTGSPQQAIVKPTPVVTNQHAPVYANVIRLPKNSSVIKVPAENAAATANNKVNGGANPVNDNKKEMLADNSAPKNNAVTNNTVPTTDAQANPVTTVNGNATGQEAVAKVPDAQVTLTATEKSKKIKTTIAGKGPQLGLAMLLSPDINGAGSFQNAKVGTNIGLLFSVSVKKLTISTGAVYSKKPYTTNFDNYYTGYKFKTDPQQVTADCRVLDIPLNIDYQVYHKSKNSFSIGSGLSSYIMLKETYNYEYAVQGTAGPSSVTYINRHQHILGVLNLNATYAHQLNNKFSIAAQPYLKIPLTDIGNSRVKLQSAGVAVGIRWNINK